MTIADDSVGNYALKDVITLKETETIGYAISMMVKHRFRRFPVVNSEEKLMGMITATDIMKELHSTGNIDIVKNKLSSIVGGEVYTLQVNETIKDAIDLMYNTGISGLPVLQRETIVGLFTEKDLILLDDLWFIIQDGLVTESEGIGRLIDEYYQITDDFTLWQALDKMMQMGQRQILVKSSDGKSFSGLFTAMRFLDFLLTKLIDEETDVSTLHTTAIADLPNLPLLQKSIPVLVSSIRLWMNQRGIEAVPLFSKGKPIKLVVEKDLVAYLNGNL